MMQAYYVLIIALFALLLFSVKSLSSTKNNNNNKPISFGSIVENDLLGKTDSNLSGVGSGTSRKKDHNDGTTNKFGWNYWCEECSCGFNKLKSYSEHIDGKRHRTVMAESKSLWKDYKESGDAFYDSSVTQHDVTRAWSLDLFIDGLQARSRSSIKHVLVAGVSNSGQIDPNLRLGDLSPIKRASFWRYLYTSGVPGLSLMVAALPPHYCRVKELLESVEVFLQVERLMKRSSVQGQKPTRISHIYDIGCGHGLVSMFCAASFPRIKVHAIDLVPRDSFLAQREAFLSTGTDISKNLSFETGDLSILQHENEKGDPVCNNDDKQHNSLLLCVHGCKSLTHESIELAISRNWAWLSLPCCLQAENHINSEQTSLKVTDNVRFAMLCGAIVAKYEPEMVTTIDSRITGRGIVLASSINSNGIM